MKRQRTEESFPRHDMFQNMHECRQQLDRVRQECANRESQFQSFAGQKNAEVAELRKILHAVKHQLGAMKVKFNEIPTHALKSKRVWKDMRGLLSSMISDYNNLQRMVQQF